MGGGGLAAMTDANRSVWMMHAEGWGFLRHQFVNLTPLGYFGNRKDPTFTFEVRKRGRIERC